MSVREICRSGGVNGGEAKRLLMFGWRKRIGYIGPTVMEVVPYEFYRFAPDGVGLVGVTCNIDDWSQSCFDRALAQVTAAAAYLGSRGVDFVIHGGGPLVVARGKGYEEIIVEDIEAAAKVPATTGVRAAMEALRHVGARRVAVASPYPERHNTALAAYLTGHGFDIVRAAGKDVPFKSLQAVPPAEIFQFAKDVIARAQGCDALYLPCPQWQAAQVVDALERDLGLPVIAYSHASFFVAFRRLGLTEHIRGHGRLLATGDMIFVRYADDFIVGHERDARRFLDEMRARLREFALTLHPEKTRLIEFGRFAERDRKARGLGKPETFNFLGFTFICGKTRAGKFQLQRKTRRDRMRAKLRMIKEEMRRRMHWPIPAQGKWLWHVVRGYFNYHAVPTNARALHVFRHEVTDLWRRTLRRRSQKDRIPWARMTQLVDDWLPKPIILHPWPSNRFAVTHPRWEPYAGKSHVRIWAGGVR